MSQQSNFTNKKLYIDKNVWLVMLATMLLCLLLLGYKKIERDSCGPFTISSKGLVGDQDGKYEAGETIIFSTTLPDEKETTWYFSDGTTRERSTSASMRHKFNNKGEYTIRAVTNGNCSSEITVNIAPSKTPIIPEEKTIQPIKIYGNSFPTVGKSEKYLSDILGNTYEWRIINKSSFPTLNQQAANYTFSKPGVYILQLTIDHNRNKRGQIEINVSEDIAKAESKRGEAPNISFPPISIPKPKAPKQDEQTAAPKEQSSAPTEQQVVTKEEPAPAAQPTTPKEQPVATKVPPAVTPVVPKRKATFIHNPIFQTYLDAVITGEKSAADFDEYLIDGGNTKVRENGKIFKTFSQFCQEIKGKRVTIKSVDLKRDPYDKTIVKQIDVETKWGLFEKHSKT